MFTARHVEPCGDVVGLLEDNRRARLPALERIATDDLSQLAVFVLRDGDDDVLVSRRTPRLIAELFRRRYAEVSRGDVDVYAVVREPGVRAKVALDWGPGDDDLIQRVFGDDDGAILKQLVIDSGDPIIDLVPTASEPGRYIGAAMQPNELVRVAIDEDAHRLLLVVADDQDLDTVQVQLASDLTGWDLCVLCMADHRARGWDAIPTLAVRKRSRAH